MAEISKALSLKDVEFQEGKIKLQEYKNFVTENIDKLQSELDKPEYADIFKKFQEGTLTNDWLSAEIERLKKNGDEYADALKPILIALEEFANKKKELEEHITAEQQLFGDITVGMMGTIGKGMGEAIASGFGSDGFKKLSENLFQGFKMILTQSLEYLEKEFLLGTAKSILEAIFNPAKAAVDTGLLIGASTAIQVAKAAINSWTPKFALGGGVTGPTYLLAGENNKKEYIISPEQMKAEVRELMKNELINRINIQNSIQKQQPAVVKLHEPINVKLAPVEMKQNGKELVGVIRLQNQMQVRGRL